MLGNERARGVTSSIRARALAMDEAVSGSIHHCPGRKPPERAGKHPAHPYKKPHTKPVYYGKR